MAPQYSATLLGSRATYTCNAGFAMTGSGVINCLSSGWELGLQCVTGRYRSTLSYWRLPFVFYMASFAVATPSICLFIYKCFSIFNLDCDLPPTIMNAPTAVFSATLLGSTATYTCDVGFGISGSGVINCLSAGWEAVPQCVTGIDCLKSHCLLLYVSFVVCFCKYWDGNINAQRKPYCTIC